MDKTILSIRDFKFHEEVGDPFLVRMHHLDYYPKGNGNMGLSNSHLEGKALGEDFDLKNPWKMYYGKEVPGFPMHPHRGFETITIVLEGTVDHSDSSGATGRYGAGDVQWMTAGSGMQHAEMFPLIHDQQENTLELFQVWLNLPGKDKMVAPYYKMLWAENIPVVVEKDEHNRSATINVIAGSYKGIESLDPNPNSWANNRDNYVGILTIHLEPGASFSLPKISGELNRNLYFYKGHQITIGETTIKANSSIKLTGDKEVKVTNGDQESYLLLLEGLPINEPVTNHGPFIMNTTDEIKQAYSDYKATQFGGWPWDSKGPVNPKEKGRFAKYDDENIKNPS